MELFLRSLQITGLGGTLVELLDPFLSESSTPGLFSPWGRFEYEPEGQRESKKGKYTCECVYKALHSQTLPIRSPWSVDLLIGFWVDDTLRCTIWGGEGPLLLVRSLPGRGFSNKLMPSSSCESEISNKKYHHHLSTSMGMKVRVCLCVYLWIPIVKQQIGSHDFIVFLFDERFLYFLLTETHLKH